MIRIGTCGVIGSDNDFDVTYVNDDPTKNPGTSAELYPAAIGVLIRGVEFQTAGTIRGASMVMGIGKVIGGIFNIMDTSRLFQVNPRTDGSGTCSINEVFTPFDPIDRFYFRASWSCANAPPYAVWVAYQGTIARAPFGMTYIFRLSPLKDRVTPCTG